MKIIISGGGTGGHIYPALAIAEGIKKIYKNVDILYVGTKDSLEEELAKKSNYRFQSIHVKGMPRKLNKKSIIAIKELFIGLSESKKIIKDFKPNLVIGTGGYVSGPILYKAARMNIPTVIHEQNAYPGITNKILSRFVRKILITYEDSRKYFKSCKDVVLTGNPVRQDIISTNKSEARKNLGIGDKPLILSFGGSGGQKSLNDSIFGILEQAGEMDKFKLIHVTGKYHYEKFIEKMEERELKLKKNIEIVPYHHNIPAVLNAADLVITSGGAIALAEISAAGKASILIPKAYTAENHQEYNARAFQEIGAAKMILEKDLNSKLLLDTILSLVENKEELSAMEINSKKLGNPGATESIVKEIHELT